MESNMRNLPADAQLDDQPVVVKGKLYAATQGQQDQLAEFAAKLGAPVPEEHRVENKGHTLATGVISYVDADGKATEIGVANFEGGFPVGSELQTLSAKTGVGKSVTSNTLHVLHDEEAPITAEAWAALGTVTSSAEHALNLATEAASGEGFSGFVVPDGDFQVMMMLHPNRDAEGKVTEVPQILVRTNAADWNGWVKPALTHGLTHGRVTAADDVTELTGFSVTVQSPSGETKQLGFLFTQIAALIPFRDVDSHMLRHEQLMAERKRLAAKKAKAKKKTNKQQAKSRRNNR